MPRKRTLDEPRTLTALRPDLVEMPRLELCATGAQGQESRVALGLHPVVVGKGSGADLVLTDARVSRMHCSFALTERGIVLRDLGSKNGTFVGDLRVSEALPAVGTVVTIGGTRLSVRVAGRPIEVPLASSPKFGEVLGTSVVMRALFAELERAAATTETILLSGESGTGKELLARAIHDRSPRKSGPFGIFDCGAVAPDVIESELFGHVRGAFTGAVDHRAGALEQANGGTLFLDELGELPLALQPKLLRALEARQFRRVGSNAWQALDARIVAATHRDLRELVATGHFRQDLYFRVAVVSARIPPLRERGGDIDVLVEHFLAEESPPRSRADLPPHAFEMLRAHDWPGNVRELKNTLARLVLFPHLGAHAFETLRAPLGSVPMHLPLRRAREHVIEQFEQTYLVAKLKEHGGNVTRAAEAMEVSRQFLHRLLDRYGIRSGAG